MSRPIHQAINCIDLCRRLENILHIEDDSSEGLTLALVNTTNCLTMQTGSERIRALFADETRTLTGVDVASADQQSNLYG
jgi:hypothetical protein